MVSLVGSIDGGLKGLASLCRSTSFSNRSHLDPNGLADPLGMKILEL